MTLEIHQERPNARPWLIAGAVVLTLHMGGVAAMLVRFFDPPPLPAPPPAILIDMEPLPVPELPQEALPVPEELPPVDLKPPPPEPEVVPDPPKPVVPSKVEMAPPPEPPPPVIEREVAVPLPPPPPPPKPKPKPVVKPKVVTPPPPLENPLPPVVDAPPPEPTPPPSVPAAPAAAPPSRPLVKTDAEVTWENQILSRLERFTRRSEYAPTRNTRPYIEVKFVIDREGNVLSTDIHVSSGNRELDRTAVNVVNRASPLPAPPPEKIGETLSITAPINLSLR
jgi:protein TonB